jgi:hypothetical protein
MKMPRDIFIILVGVEEEVRLREKVVKTESRE